MVIFLNIVSLLFKVRHYVQKNGLKNVHRVILESHLRYRCEVSPLSNSKSIAIYRKTTDNGNTVIPLSDFGDFTFTYRTENPTNQWHCWFAKLPLSHSFLYRKQPISFETLLQRFGDVHNAPKWLRKSTCLHVPHFKKAKYGMNSIPNDCIHSWDNATQIS